jgi:glyoxylase-like metal-dependent hydrolase (beta-lactamase superfamily II)
MKGIVPREIAEDVWLVVLGRRPLDSNVYLVRSGGSWVLIDTGWPGNGLVIRRAAETLFGRGVAPAAILLTHVHIDHTGSVGHLAAAWDVPVFVHPLEVPMAGGYVPQYANALDRRVVLPLLRLLPRRSRDRVLTGNSLSGVVRPLDPARPPPGLPDWTCVSAPGHTPGSVAFFRPPDRLLVTGDALLTVDLTSLRGLLGGRRQLAEPLRFTDWDPRTTEHTIGALARLQPRALAPGHGRPVAGPSVPHDLRAFAELLLAPQETASS